MKQILYFTFAVLLLLTGCRQNEEPVIQHEIGTVVNYAGAEFCSIVIELDNGHKILPLHYPEDFVFVHGQKLLVSFMELPNIISTCGKGTACEIMQAEEIQCGSPVVEVELKDFHKLPNDPLQIQQVNIDGDCLRIKVLFSGGCRNHEFSLVHVNGIDTDENTLFVELIHDAKGDVCEAALSNELSFSLKKQKNEGYTKILLQAQLDNGEVYSELFDLD
jgi:hypothetical protein